MILQFKAHRILSLIISTVLAACLFIFAFGNTAAFAASETASETVPAEAPEAVPAEAPAAPDNAAVIAVPVAEPVSSDLSAGYADLTQNEKAQILNRLGVLLGDPDRGLMLDIKVRRSDAAVFFTRLLGQEQYVKDRSETDFALSRFPDAPEGMWYTPYISFCTSIGIIAGRTDGYYYPDDNISEKEFANVLLKILGYEYEIDYSWDSVYEFSYDIGLFDDIAYATRKEDNREYYRRDVCDQVFAVLSLEKKNSDKFLIEELIEVGAISEITAADLGFDLSGLDLSFREGDWGYPVDADIYAVYHLEADLLWVIFTKPVTFRDEAVEICQTYDYSRILTARVEEKTGRDMLLRTGEQLPGMDYTIDISNVLESNGTNAGMLSFDFTGFSPDAAADSPGGITTLKRDVNALPGGYAPPQTGAGASSAGAGTGGQASAGLSVIDDTGDNEDWGGTGGTGGTGSGAGAAQGTGAATGAVANPPRSSGNADPTADYFRITNAYTTASDELVLYFSQPISNTALQADYYSIVQGSTILCSGSAGQISAELLDNTVNSVKLTTAGFSFTRGTQYRATVSGRLTSNYTARLNEGYEDSFAFTAENVAVRYDNFILASIVTTSQYCVELTFSQPVNLDVAKQLYNYSIMDSNDRKIEITSVSVVPDAATTGGTGAGYGASAAGSSPAGSGNTGKLVRITISQPLLTHQNCSLIVIYAQNSAATASIVNQTYQFQYGGQGATIQKSSIALTGAISNDPSTAEIYFSHKLDPASAVIGSNYSVNGMFDGKNYTITPVKVSYDPLLTPYMVRLYFQSDRRFVKDRPYSLRVSNALRDEKKLSPDRVIEMQFYANNRDPAPPTLKDAVIIGEGIVRLDFTKEIMFDPSNITESNFTLIDANAGAGTSSALQGLDSQTAPILVKFIDTTTIILRFDALDMSRKFRVQFNAITDFSGQYTTYYPDQGSSVALRNGKK